MTHIHLDCILKNTIVLLAAVLDGIHATEEIRQLEGPASRLPIYILSADVLAQNKLRHLNIDGYLTKPISWPTVFGVISEQLQAQAAGS